MWWLLLTLVPLAVSSETASPGSYNPTAAPNQDSQFDIELLKSTYGTSKNVLLSPSSIKVSLAMLGEATVGSAVGEIYKVLGIPPSERNQVFSNLISELSDSQPLSLLKFQNALFVSDTKTIKPLYRETVQTYFRALVKQINYNDRVRAASEINGFVKNATNGFIPSILSPDEIDYNTEIILTNVLYFKADWLKIFDSKLTKKGCFHAPTGCVDVKLMHTLDIFSYADTPNAYIVKLEYAGNSRAMLLVVPKAKDGLSNVLKDLGQQRFKELLATLSPTEVELMLPKFEIDYNQNLIGIFQKMGIKQVFGPQANLTNLLEGTQSIVDSFIHKTKIEVGEEGTEASAVSLISVIPLMGSSNPKIKADHPFVFFIYNTKTSDILFEGILNEPEPLVSDVKPATPYQSRTYSQAVQSNDRSPNSNYNPKLNQNPSGNSN